ncbi:MAG: 16S rRNA (guanine(527)-N(7))-methyltransferase RsmG [Anaerolineae bacterium]
MTLQDHAHAMGIELSDAQVAAFQRFQSELLDWNQRMNLTSITGPAEIETKHFLDSLSCLLALPHIDRRPLAAWLASSPKTVDIGAGAGLPGLALKIVWPGLRLTLLEATGKKCRFMQHVVDTLGLTDVTVVQARAEDFGQHAGRLAFDLALARAVTRLPTLLEYGLPLLKRGGWFVIQKGREPQEELAQSRLALQTLGGSLHDVLPVAVPGLDAERSLILVAKAAQTPAAYPRRAGIPERQPILP